jgi:hypothetical protein
MMRGDPISALTMRDLLSGAALTNHGTAMGLSRDDDGWRFQFYVSGDGHRLRLEVRVERSRGVAESDGLKRALREAQRYLNELAHGAYWPADLEKKVVRHA